MGYYWVRQRLFLTLIVSVAVALATSFLFVYPSIMQRADTYNSQSVYKNTDIDFIAPEPSFEQVDDLPGTNGINNVFPFFLTKTQVDVNGTSRTTTVLLSDRFQNIDLTMYNSARLIEKSNEEYDNGILVDWQFCHDTGAGIGDTVSFLIDGEKTDFKISSIYETNSIYDGGAVLAELSEDQKNSIAKQSSNNGYSGMYISANDYNTCQTFLTTEYRPLGRLKNRDQFSNDDQYQVHYDAIMSSDYANEITDFRIRENTSSQGSGVLMIWIGALLAAAIMIGFNVSMTRRGCERVYFEKQCVPKGQNIKPYYTISFAYEILFSIVSYAVLLILRIETADTYIPRTAIGFSVVIVPVAIIIAEIINLRMNSAMVSEIVRKVELEKQKEAERKAQKDAASSEALQEGKIVESFCEEHTD